MSNLGLQVAQQQRWHRQRMGDTVSIGGTSYYAVTQARAQLTSRHPQAVYLGALAADLDGRAWNLDYQAFGTLPVAGDSLTWQGRAYILTRVAPEVAAGTPVGLVVEGHRSSLDTSTLLNGTATLRRNTTASDGAGGQTFSWADAGTLACYLGRQGTAEEDLAGEALVAQSSWWCVLPLAADVHPPDRLVIAGETFEVTDTDRGLTGAVVLVAQLRRVGAN